MSTAKYRAANKEKITAAHKAYNATHKEKLAAYNAAHKEEMAAYRAMRRMEQNEYIHTYI